MFSEPSGRCVFPGGAGARLRLRAGDGGGLQRALGALAAAGPAVGPVGRWGDGAMRKRGQGAGAWGGREVGGEVGGRGFSCRGGSASFIGAARCALEGGGQLISICLLSVTLHGASFMVSAIDPQQTKRSVVLDRICCQAADGLPSKHAAPSVNLNRTR